MLVMLVMVLMALMLLMLLMVLMLLATACSRCVRYNLTYLLLANAVLVCQALCRVRDGGHLLAVIFPGPTRGWTTTRNQLIDDGHHIRHTGQRKTCIKWPLTSDVGPDAQPIGSQIIISYPALQVGCERCAWGDNRFGRRKPQKIAAA